MQKPVLGLIGGIGSGKSSLAEELARRGGRVINADRFGHEALRQPDIRRRAAERWAKAVLDEKGEIDRPRLGAIVFADPAERKILESWSFPFIGQRCREAIAEAQRDPMARFVVLDAAVMLEAGWDQGCDYLIFVDAPRELRYRRLVQQRGWDAKEVEARENAQWPLAEKQVRADFVIANDGSHEELVRQVDVLLRKLSL